MMREARVIFPRDASEEASAWLERQLVEIFEGYTRTHGKGAWQNGAGKIITEAVEIYDVAMVNTVTNWQNFRWVAETAGRMAKQDCVYVRSADGEVFFVQTGSGPAS